MFNKKEAPLLKILVTHTLPGRVRLNSRALKYLDEVKSVFEEKIASNVGINSVSLNCISGSILITYDTEVMNEVNIISIVELNVGAHSLIAFKKERELRSITTVNERRLQEESVSTMLTRVLVTAGFLSFFAMKGRRDNIMRRSLSRNLTSLPSLVSLGLSRSIIISGIESVIKDKRPNADTLTMSAIITAVLTGRSLSALMTILLSDIAELLTVYTMDQTRKAISEMLNSTEDEVFVVDEDGQLKRVSISEVVQGDILSIQTGDKVSVDGTITEGNAFIDQSSITGEYFPVQRGVGDHVFAGTVLKSGNIRVNAEKVGDDTTVSRIVHLVEDAASKKAQIQSFADNFSAHLIPLNFALAGIVFFVTKDVNRALSMMIIDYSCGVRLSTATALSACIHNAAKNGVLIKGGNYVEMLAESDTLVLDKTGTMTEGKPRVLSVITNDGISEENLLAYAAAAEEDTSHPLGLCILNAAKERGYALPTHNQATVVIGCGVEVTIDLEETTSLIQVGNRKLMKQNNIDYVPLKEQIRALEKRGESVIYVAKDGILIGLVGVHDALKENMKKSLNRLRYLGYDDVRLLTGDMEFQAEKMAVRMNMDDYASELMPEDKARTILQLQSIGTKVIMIGDGINDAPALAYADVGIAIGNTRTDVAIEAADITVTNDDPLLIPSTVVLARKTMKTIKQNFAFVVGINSIGIVTSAIGWLPVFWGSVLHNSTTVFLVLNSGRLLINDFERRIVK